MAFCLAKGEDALIAKFRTQGKKIFDKYPEQRIVKDAMTDEVTCCRFLRGRGLDVAKALEMFEATCAWRKKHDVDNTHTRAFPKLPELKAVYPYGFHKFDKMGRPVYFDVTGKMDVKLINAISTMEEMMEIHINQCEYISQHLYPLASERCGKRIHQITSVVDLKGLSKKQLTKKAYAFLKALAKCDQDNYPESLGKLLMINVPLIFKVAWKIVKPWLDQRTKDKIKICKGKDVAKELLNLIAKEDLPVEYGGTCKCPGGCIQNSELEQGYRAFALRKHGKDLEKCQAIASEHVKHTRRMSEELGDQPGDELVEGLAEEVEKLEAAGSAEGVELGEGDIDTGATEEAAAEEK